MRSFRRLGRSSLLLRAPFVGLLIGLPPAAGTAQSPNPNPPSSPVRLIFIHHSTGENWLSDDDGGLGLALRDSNYFVSDTNYGWGPTDYEDDSGTIGDHTDIGHWYSWFSGPYRGAYLTELYDDDGVRSPYSRLANHPGGENRIVLFKSCFPNSALGGSPDDPVPPIDGNPLRGQGAWSEAMTVANAKGIYNEVLAYFATRPDKLFVVVTAPPLVVEATDATQAANARAFNDWLVNDWLSGYPYHNVFVFDFFDVLTSNAGSTRTNAPDTNDLGWADGNHHRYRNGAVEHLQTVPFDFSAYGSGGSDSHPSRAGNLKATGEFVSLLNVAYHCWVGDGGCPSSAGPATGASGDFDGDLRSDILWRHTGGALYVWQMNGTALTASSYLPPISLAWRIQGLGDFNGDGKSDLLWREATSGNTYIWLMSGASAIGQGYTPSQADNTWTIQGVGDFDGDGKSDILWRHTGGALYLWQMNGTSVKASSYLPPISTAWTIRALGDFNGDGKTDILWREAASGSTYVWLMNGATAIGSGYTGSLADNSWAIQGVGDFDGDGRSDILWRHTGGALYIWQMNGTALKASSYLPPISLSWTVRQLGDYNGDGRTDILWREWASGSTYEWLMDGAVAIGSGYTASQANNSWVIQGR